MISIDRFEEILSDLAEEIPQSFYEELNGGIVVEPGYLLHPADRSGTLYVMGQYRIDPAILVTLIPVGLISLLMYIAVVSPSRLEFVAIMTSFTSSV